MTRYQAGTQHTCQHCGSEFTLSYSREGKPTYCGTECAGDASRTPNPTVDCDHCGSEFETTEYRLNRNDSHYCSNECQTGAQTNRVDVQCVVCGTRESVTKTREKTYQTCSTECRGVLQSGRRSGEENPNFKDTVDTATLVAEYREGASTTVLAKRYGMTNVGVAHRLRMAGVDLRDAGYPKTVETDRGEMVRSYYEKEVADWLNGQAIDYQYEPDGFPGPYLPDFVVDGTVIEVWGFSSSEYEARRQDKERWYAQHNITCVGVDPDDIGDLETTLKILLP